MISLRRDFERYVMKDERSEIAIKKHILQILNSSTERKANIEKILGEEFNENYRKAIISLIRNDQISMIKDGIYELL